MDTFSKITRNIRAWWEFNKETSVTYVSPLFNTAYCWDELSDVPDMNKAKTIYFEQLKEKELKVSHCEKDGFDLWKLYIIGENSIQRVYIEKRMMNPICEK